MLSESLLVGFDTSDDACVYKVSDDKAVIQTVDFFTPITDDPYMFGQIAAANALSDVYAMGGTPALAMNLLCVPNCLSKDTIREILRGGHDKAVEAGCVIAGGHTIQDSEPKYGLCVTGFVHPDHILKNVGAMAGDVLILTKPIGSGIIVTAKKAELVSDEDYMAAANYMRRLNKWAGESIQKFGCIHACTDITGFGLGGHALEVARGSNVTILIDSAKLPIMDGALEMAEMGMVPGGAYRNADYAREYVTISENVDEAYSDIIFDPQTSGGLLVALPESEAAELLSRLRKTDPASCIVGKVLPKGEKPLIIVKGIAESK